MDVSKKIRRIQKKFFTLIFGVHRRPQSGDVHALPPAPPAAPCPPPVVGGLYLSVSPLHVP